MENMVENLKIIGLGSFRVFAVSAVLLICLARVGNKIREILINGLIPIVVLSGLFSVGALMLLVFGVELAYVMQGLVMLVIGFLIVRKYGDV